MNFETDYTFPLTPGFSKEEIEQRFWKCLYTSAREEMLITGLCFLKASNLRNWSRLRSLVSV